MSSHPPGRWSPGGGDGEASATSGGDDRKGCMTKRARAAARRKTLRFERQGPSEKAPAACGLPDVIPPCAHLPQAYACQRLVDSRPPPHPLHVGCGMRIRTISRWNYSRRRAGVGGRFVDKHIVLPRAKVDQSSGKIKTNCSPRHLAVAALPTAPPQFVNNADILRSILPRRFHRPADGGVNHPFALTVV